MGNLDKWAGFQDYSTDLPLQMSSNTVLYMVREGKSQITNAENQGNKSVYLRMKTEHAHAC